MIKGLGVKIKKVWGKDSLEEIQEENDSSDEEKSTCADTDDSRVGKTRQSPVKDASQPASPLLSPQKLYQLLWEFIESNDEQRVKSLLATNPEIDVNFKGLDNWTALHRAAAKGFEALTILLIDCGCCIDAKTSLSRTPLHLACLNNHQHIVLVLLDKKCDLDVQDNDNNTALHYAARQGCKETVVVLLANGANSMALNAIGRNPADLCLDFETFLCFQEFCKEFRLTGYSRTVVGSSFRHNSREDHVSQMIWKGRIAHNKNDFELFYNRPKLKKKICLFESKVTAEDFEVLLQLGQGNFGSVFLVKKKDTKEKFALKVMDKEKIFEMGMEKYAVSERNILMKLENPFIVKLHYAFQTREKLALVMEFCSKGDLRMLMRREKSFPEEVTRFYACEIILALEALHKHNIIFRDLKPDNILIDESNHIKLTDFGLSKEVLGKNAETKSFCGSPLYLAPEMLKKTGHSKSIDWYVVGLLIYEMLHGKSPFFSADIEELFRKIKKGKVFFKENISHEAQDLILKLLEKNPKKRIGSGVRGAEEIKEHPFFRGIDWQKMGNREVNAPNVESIERIEKKMPIEMVFGKLGEDEERLNVNDWSFLHRAG